MSAEPEKDCVRCARGEEGYCRRLRFSAKLERFETEGEGPREEESFRGVWMGVVVVEEMAVVLIACGLMTGDRLLVVASCRDEIDAGREELEEVAEEDMAACLEGSMRSDYEVVVYAAGTLDDQSRGRCSVVTRRLEGKRGFRDPLVPPLRIFWCFVELEYTKPEARSGVKGVVVDHRHSHITYLLQLQSPASWHCPAST